MRMAVLVKLRMISNGYKLAGKKLWGGGGDAAVMAIENDIYILLLVLFEGKLSVKLIFV